jgi:pimeloyl-ACP methyl ester carboxylesterase
VETLVQVQGTLTSTMPPVFILATGPHLSHEYLPDHMRFLLPGRLLVYYDMRATGLSGFGDSNTSTITADQHAADLEDVRLWMGTQGADVDEIDLIGHGYGGGIAALYTAAHNDRVAHLVLVTPYPATARQQATYKQEVTTRLTSTERAFINNLEMQPSCRANRSRCRIEMWNVQGPHYMCDQNRTLFRDLFFEHGSPRAEEYVEQELRNKQFDWGPTFAMITVPTTVIAGPCDAIPADTIASYTSSIAGSVLHTLSNSGHFPMVEQPAEFQSLIRQALRR